jgi:hypothetical protein
MTRFQTGDPMMSEMVMLQQLTRYASESTVDSQCRALLLGREPFEVVPAYFVKTRDGSGY